MLWIVQSKESKLIHGIFRDESTAFDLYGYNDNLNIYWVESDL